MTWPCGVGRIGQVGRKKVAAESPPAEGYVPERSERDGGWVRRRWKVEGGRVGAAAGGMTYPAVGQAVRGIARRRESSASMRRLTQELEDRLLSDRR
jgi:hypothetical protein